MATTSGQAGRNLYANGAAGLASLGFSRGGYELSFSGIAYGSANLVLGGRACAPPLLRRIVEVGGASMALRRGMLERRWKARESEVAVDESIAVREVAQTPVCLGGRVAWNIQETDCSDLGAPRPRRSAFVWPAHRHVTRHMVSGELNGGYNVADGGQQLAEQAGLAGQ